MEEQQSDFKLRFVIILLYNLSSVVILRATEHFSQIPQSIHFCSEVNTYSYMDVLFRNTFEVLIFQNAVNTQKTKSSEL